MHAVNKVLYASLLFERVSYFDEVGYQSIERVTVCDNRVSVDQVFGEHMFGIIWMDDLGFVVHSIHPDVCV